MTPVIDPQAVIKVAVLARLSREQNLLDGFAKELESIIEHSNQINEVNVEGKDPFEGIRTITLTELREDHPVPFEEIEEYNKTRELIISNFPNSVDGLLVIPGIFENS